MNYKSKHKFLKITWKFVAKFSIIYLICFVFCGYANAQQDSNYLGQKTTINTHAADIELVLEAIAKTSGLPVGFVSSSKTNSAKAKITYLAKDKQLSEILDDLFPQSSEYAWSFEKGVINVFPKRGSKKLLDITISNIVLEGNTLQIGKEILQSPEVVLQVKNMNFNLELFKEDDSTLKTERIYQKPNNETFNLTFQSIKLEELLNQLLRNKAAIFWSLSKKSESINSLTLKLAS